MVIAVGAAIIGTNDVAHGQEMQERTRNLAPDSAPPVKLAQTAQTIIFDIPAKPLFQALDDFSAATAIRVLDRRTLAGELRSNPVAGSYTPEEALALMLADTGIGYRFIDARTVKLEEAALTGQPGPIRLEPVKITGEWLGLATEQDVKTYPGARSVLTEQELNRSGARNLEDALRQVPGIRVEDETGTGTLPNIGIRGLNPLRSERVMMLQDGVPLALAPYTGTGLSLFPVTFETVRRVDVVRGGVAVHHGPNNVGGVINLISEPIAQNFAAEAEQKITIAGEAGNVLSDTYARTGGFVTPNFGLQAQVNFLTGEAFRDHSETDVTNLILDAEWLVTDSAEMKARLQYYDVDAELPGALSPDAYEDDRTESQRPFDSFDADTLRASLTYTHFRGDSQEFNWLNFVNLADREFTFGQPFDPEADPVSFSISPREFFVVGTEPRYTWRFETGGLGHGLTLGGRYVREEIDFIVEGRSLLTDAVDRIRDWRFETNAFAGYVSDTLSFSDGRLQITPGLRVESVNTDFRDLIAETDSSNEDFAFLPGLAIGHQLTDKVFLFANTNRSLRPPQVAQVTRGGDVGSELAWNYEVGARVSPTAAFDATATLFRIDFSDQIEFDRPSQRFKNLGETRHQGIELEATWRPAILPRSLLQAGYTFVDAEQRSGEFSGNEVPFASEHQLSLTAVYEIDGYDFSVNGFHQSDAFADAANTEDEAANGAAGEIPSYWRWNLQVAKDFEAFSHPLRLAAAVNNIFDKDYYFRGVDTSPIGRLPAPGRAFILSIKAAL